MKVIFVTRGWPTKKDPMMGNYEAVQAKALAKRGVDVTVVNIEYKSLIHFYESGKIKKREEDNGVTILSSRVLLTEIPKVRQTRNNCFDLWLKQKAFLRVYEYYRRIKGDVDVIHAQFVIYAHICKQVLHKYHIPFVITEHWSRLNGATIDKSFLRCYEAYQWADKVICVSNVLADSLKTKFGVESVVINNMVSDQFFDQTQLKKENGKKEIVKFVSVGSLVHIKGYDLIIRALQRCDCLEKCQISIIGGGPEEANLQALIEQCQLQNRVFLLGTKTPEEVSSLMMESDCFILASRRETFGIVYIEAMAKGKPVIATICGGPESFVNESNGILIPVEDVDATANAIDYMVENLDKFDGSAIREFCYNNFSEESITQQIVAVYKEVINKNGKTNV